MKMNTNIPMMGANLNYLATMAQGAQTAHTINQVGRQNKLATLFREQGPALMQGDPNALAAYSRLDAPGAMEMQTGMAAHRSGMQVDEARLELLRQQSQTESYNRMSAMETAEREREAEEMSQFGARLAVVFSQQGEEAARQFVIQNSEIVGPELAEAHPLEVLAVTEGGLDGYEAAQKRQTTSYITSGEQAQELGLTGPGAWNVTSGPRGMQAEAIGGTSGQPESDREIQRLMSIGLPYDVAVKIKEGVYKTVTDPITRETVVLDLGTRQPVFRIGADEAQQANAAQPSSLQTEPKGAESAFGLSGMGARFGNWLSDAAGMGEMFPQVAEQQRFFKVLEEDLLVDLSQAYGRQPAQALMERLRSLAPQAGTMEGASAARGELKALRDRFSGDLEVARKSLRRRMKPGERTEAEARAAGLEAAIGRIDRAISRFAEGKASTTSSGIKWKVVD